MAIDIPVYDNMAESIDSLRNMTVPKDDAADIDVKASQLGDLAHTGYQENDNRDFAADRFEVVSLPTKQKEALPNEWRTWNSGVDDKNFWNRFDGTSNAETAGG